MREIKGKEGPLKIVEMIGKLREKATERARKCKRKREA